MGAQIPAASMYGVKCGSTRIFLESGVSVPVSVVKIEQHVVTQVKTTEKHGYNAIQIATVESKKPMGKARAGQFKSAKPCKHLKEIRLTEEAVLGYKPGDVLDFNDLASCAYVDVQGMTIGKGFAGTIKLHHFKGSDATHGNSKAHRKPGSIGQCQDPGRVFKGKKMAARMGNNKRTVQSLEVVSHDADQGLLMIKGAIPGPVGQMVWVFSSLKKTQKRVIENES